MCSFQAVFDSTFNFCRPTFDEVHPDAFMRTRQVERTTTFTTWRTPPVAGGFGNSQVGFIVPGMGDRWEAEGEEQGD